MRTALYFPHTDVRSEALVRTALLTWDALEYIAPYPHYPTKYPTPGMARAMELIGRPRIPTVAEQKRVHELIEDLLRAGVPETFRYSPADHERTEAYDIWPQKLAEPTWKLLEEHGLTSGFIYHADGDYPTSQAAGLTLMAILADVMAGETRARITDRGDAYATIANAPNVTAEAQEHDRVVALTFKGIAIDKVPIDRLIAFREREEKESQGHHYRKLRHDYLAAVEKHVESISNVPIDSADRIERDRVFASDMDDDLRDLKSELGFAKGEAWFSNEIVALVIAGAALLDKMATAVSLSLALPAVLAGTGSVVLLGGLLSTVNKLGKARYEVLRKHPMAYLYELDRRRERIRG